MCGRHLSDGTGAIASPAFRCSASPDWVPWVDVQPQGCCLFASIALYRYLDWDLVERLYPGNWELLRAFRRGVAC